MREPFRIRKRYVLLRLTHAQLDALDHALGNSVDYSDAMESLFDDGRDRAMWHATYVVSGSGEFPIDMLRYDSSFPSTQRDARLIQHEDGVREVTLERYSRNPDGLGRRSRERWLSFGWSVVAVLAATF